MQTGKIQIWNMALGYIGTRSIASESEVTPEAQLCALYWDSARRQALRAFPWPWAQRRVALAQADMPDVYANEWRCCYALPANCLKLHRMLPRGGVPPLVRRVPFRLVYNDAGATLVLAQEASALADYTVDVADVTLWDDLFVNLMARRLACLIAVPLLKNNQGKVSELEQLYRAAIPSAEEGAASEQQDRPQPDSWLLSRGGDI